MSKPSLSGQLSQSDPQPEALQVVEHYLKLATDFQIKTQVVRLV